MTRQPSWAGLCSETNRLQGVLALFSYYPTNGTFQSAVYDTHQAAPSFQAMSWSSSVPSGASIRMKVRTANSDDMSDASDWTAASWISSPGAISPGAKRYVQYLAELQPSAGGADTPKLRNVQITFAGERKVVDIGGSFTKGPNYGAFELTVDGVKLQKGVTVAMQVYNDVGTPGGGTKRLTSKASVEVEPRNTGK